MCHLWAADKQINKTYNTLFNLVFVKIATCISIDYTTEVFLANHLASTTTHPETEH